MSESRGTFSVGCGSERVNAIQLRKRLESAAEQARAARASWGELAARDLGARLGGHLVGGLVLGRLVRRLGR